MITLTGRGDAHERPVRTLPPAMSRPFRTTLALAFSLSLLSVACGAEEPVAAPATTGPALPTRTTLAPQITVAPEITTSTTTPAIVATAVNACGLVTEEEVAEVTADPGPGTPSESPEAAPDTLSAVDGRRGDTTAPPPTAEDAASDETANVLLSSCSWPTEGAAEVTLSYLAPTTADSGLEHLQRIVDGGSRFARGARVLPLQASDELEPAVLIDEEGAVLELAVLSGSALVYIVPNTPPPGDSTESNDLLELLLHGARRAPG
jgi:hypothetical protein